MARTRSSTRADRLFLQDVELGPGDGPLVLAADAEGHVPAEDLLLLVLRRVLEPVGEHEAVELGLGELEGPALLDRVLGGDHQERRRQGEGVVADRHLPLLHRLEQGALDLRRGPVDLVGQQEVREDRPAVGPEVVGPLVEDLRADDVRRQEVDGELDPLEVEVDRLGQDRDEQGLRQAGHALQEQVAAGEQGDQGPLDDDVLADDDGADPLADAADELDGLGRDRDGGGGRRGWAHRWHNPLVANRRRLPAGRGMPDRAIVDITGGTTPTPAKNSEILRRADPAVRPGDR